MAAGKEDKYFKGLVIAETVKRAAVSELTSLGTHLILSSDIRLRQVQKKYERYYLGGVFLKLISV